MDAIACNIKRKDSWNKGRLLGQKQPLKLKEIWAIRIRLQLAERLRDLALFNLAIDSKLSHSPILTDASYLCLWQVHTDLV